MLNRNRTRTILNSIETSEKTLTLNSKSLAFNILTTDSFYVGFQDKFACRYFSLKVANTNPNTVSVDYWNGTSYVPVLDLIDQTFGFTESGFISWTNGDDWQKSTQSPVVDEELYWIRVKVSANLSASTEVEAVLNLFSDDKLLRAYYPDLITDSRFLPPNRTNFLEQHEASKNQVIQRLIQKRMIAKEGQVIDINQVAVASVHGCAAIILAPIAVSEHHLRLLIDARDQFEKELSLVSLNIDLDEDGKVDEYERVVTRGYITRV